MTFDSSLIPWIIIACVLLIVCSVGITISITVEKSCAKFKKEYEERIYAERKLFEGASYGDLDPLLTYINNMTMKKKDTGISPTFAFESPSGYIIYEPHTNYAYTDGNSMMPIHLFPSLYGLDQESADLLTKTIKMAFHRVRVL